jgi:hypothetical protein
VYCSLYMRGFWWFRVLCFSPSFVVSDVGFFFLIFYMFFAFYVSIRFRVFSPVFDYEFMII